jgi:hypothetical protein
MMPTALNVKCSTCGAEPKLVSLSEVLGQDVPGETIVPSCMCWESREKVETAKALRRQRTSTAYERFVRLGFGPPQNLGRGIEITKDMAWCFPAKAAADRKHLLVYGDTGHGKSTTIYRVAWALCLSGLRPRGGYVPTLVHNFRGEDGHEEVNDVMDGDVLVLDDMDKLRGTEYQIETFSSLVDHYDSRGLPILVTLNLHPEGFLERLMKNGVPKDMAMSLESRIRHRSEILQASGQDFRKAEAK